MQKITTLFLIAALAITAMGPRAVAAPRKRAEFSIEGVNETIEDLIDHLWKHQEKDGGFGRRKKRGGHNKYPLGPSSLATLALLEAGVPVQDPRMKKALEYLTGNTHKTYTLGLRANVWMNAYKQTREKKFRELLEHDVKLLVTSTKDGSYNYNCRGQGKSSGDNSNSHYGLYGAWAGVLAGLEMNQKVMQAYWMKVLKHWLKDQCEDGGWQYRRAGAKGKTSLTPAGCVSVFVCMDNLYVQGFENCRERTPNAVDKAIEAGLEWMAKNWNGGGNGYTLYNVERLGLASGLKYFGTTDWYKAGATRLIGTKGKGKRGTVIESSFALLFLVRGRNAVLFNKLKHEGDWRNRPRDLARVTRWLTNQVEKKLYWQIIGLEVPTSEWHDAPILIITGSNDPEFTDKDIAKLRKFVHEGGMILGVAECRGRGFDQAMREAYKKMFPKYELMKLPPEHPLYNLQYKLKGQPDLWELSNGVRPLVIHTNDDLTLSWQLNRYATETPMFQAAGNIYAYVTDMGQLRQRGAEHWPADPGRAGKTIKVARIKWPGNYDPEPLALERFARKYQAETGVGIAVVELEPEQLPGSGAAVAFLTGTSKLKLTPAQRTALKRYALEHDGRVIVDAACGNRAFADSATQVLEETFGMGSLVPLYLDHASLCPDGKALEKLYYRRSARRIGRRGADARLRHILDEGRSAVVFSREDLTTGLLAVEVYGCKGYQPESAYRIVRNLLRTSSGPSVAAGKEEVSGSEEQSAKAGPSHEAAEDEVTDPNELPARHRADEQTDEEDPDWW